jgi:hypothetical protein
MEVVAGTETSFITLGGRRPMTHPVGMTKGMVLPCWIGCRDPRSQRRDLGHPSIFPKLSFQWDGCGGTSNY